MAEAQNYKFTCPVCGKRNRADICGDCGFDNSRNYEDYASLTPAPDGAKSIDGKRAEYRERFFAKQTPSAAPAKETTPEPQSDETVRVREEKTAPEAKPKTNKTKLIIGIAAAAAVCAAACIAVVVMQNQNSAETPVGETTSAETVETSAEAGEATAVEEVSAEPEEEPAAENNTSVPISSDLSVGDMITFGHYEQDNDISDGAEPIEWEVLAAEDGQALVISRYVLDALAYNEEDENVSWENCTLYAWLNKDFLTSAFTDEEQLRILIGTAQTQVFLLNDNEVEEYLPYYSGRICCPTAYAVAQGNLVGETTACWWWLRSPCGCIMDREGSIYYYVKVDRSNGGIRPAMWISLES